MAAHSGKHGSVLVGSCDLSEVESWELNYGTEILAYHSRAGAGAKKTEDGPEGGSGTLTMFLDPTNPVHAQIVSGTVYAVTLYHDTTSLVGWSGNARFGEFRSSVDLNGPLQKVTIAFETDGAWTEPS